ncbi:hypothetical protein CAPTEDRAFT_185184 [Capitella teleta]|uniref:Helitron helicase-like domain-containing protein n=1 Tax=Capitella teleta TaxID=283909 RepID=R7TUL7_CAPTE|nr:hypothetical protein CAPTEDRAFT_185184 [Capitella teleta]|eukprot:ELT97359.1 hypothetical protein CAPTEDRAFT_185184 [Capitella teleta]
MQIQLDGMEEGFQIKKPSYYSLSAMKAIIENKDSLQLTAPHGPFGSSASPDSIRTSHKFTPRRPPKSYWLKSAFHYNPNINYRLMPKVSIDGMTNVCLHCQAKKWPGEPPAICCSNGKIKLPQFRAPPEQLQRLLTDNTTRALHFRQKAWHYNMAFAMTSFGADKNATPTDFFTTFQVQGQCYHRIGSLLPPENGESKFLQVYFLNGEEEIQQRCKLNAGLRRDIIQELQDILHELHPYVSSLKYALE